MNSFDSDVEMVKIGDLIFPADMLGDLKKDWDLQHALLANAKTAAERAKISTKIHELTKQFAIRNAGYLMMKAYRPVRSIMGLGLED